MKFLFVVTKGLEKAGSAIRAIQIATITAEEGNHVEVFLLDEAVHWAQGIRAVDGEGLADYTEMLKSGEHAIMVCKSCATKRLITQDSLIEGTVIAEMPVLVQKLTSPEYRVFIF
jgi:sulfur relay (sulfurtransferase) complex TusBCD TusD component (DsrE family)